MLEAIKVILETEMARQWAGSLAHGLAHPDVIPFYRCSIRMPRGEPSVWFLLSFCWQLRRVKMSHATVCRDEGSQPTDVKGDVLNVCPSTQNLCRGLSYHRVPVEPADHHF